jgi:TRAP-type mannitol/chloroaromatic compound transport system permease small subunit
MFSIPRFFRIFCYLITSLTFAFLINNILTHYLGWPGTNKIFTKINTGTVKNIFLLYVQIIIYLLAIILPFVIVLFSKKRSLKQDSETLSAISSYIVHGIFWTALIVGIIDFIISFFVSEKIIQIYISDKIHLFLSSPQNRITFIHAPLAIFGFVIAFYNKKIGFIWLATLVVIAEGLIVISRFVYSYEQTFMGDLVRYWYAALFLLGSAHTLVKEGHVRVDILYARAKEKTQALLNIIGSTFFGIPLCALVMVYGMDGRSSTINSPIVNFEVTSQATAGLYVKYMMAGFLGIFAVTMIIQFASYILFNANKIYKKK